MYGTVKYYNQQKCYGFIGTSDGKEYFFHISGLNKNYGGKPNADDNVEFKVSEPNDKGSVCAYNIKPILTLNMMRKAVMLRKLTMLYRVHQSEVLAMPDIRSMLQL